MIELEKTFLARNIPENIRTCEKKEIIDIYIPKEEKHPRLRVRKNGDKYEMTKKLPLDNSDASRQEETTINLTEKEFKALERIEGKKVKKTRYYYPHEGQIAEIDIFEEALEGLVVIDFEFATIKAQESFQMPEFCLADITQEDFIAGGILAGKSYKDINSELEKFNYKKLTTPK